MKMRLIASASMFCLGCAGRQGFREADTAPYKAVVVFRWLGESPGAPRSTALAGGGGVDAPAGEPDGAAETKVVLPPSLTREWVEDRILDGLEEYEVFSDFTLATLENMQQVARREKADLILLVRIGSLAASQPGASSAVPSMAILDAVLWLGTGIGAWWVPDREFPTHSDVEISWTRPEVASGPAPSLEPSSKGDLGEFKLKEPLSSGDYRLSLWDRAKPWRYPWAYLLTVLLPPVLVPLQDREEVDHSLSVSALQDITRDMARKLKSGYLRSGGSPFLFRLEGPRNGSSVPGGSVKLTYKYRVEPGFEEHQATRLSALQIDLKAEGSSQYRTVRRYSNDTMRPINEKIGTDDPIEEEIDGLRPGLNLIRFAARTEQGGQWITNTVALLRR